MLYLSKVLRKLLLILSALFVCINILHAQPKEFSFKNFTQEDGLPSNESYFIYSDSKRFLWIATDQGVVRFDGSKMERFNLPDNVVFKIREDKKGRIWFFSYSGKLAYFFNDKIYPYQYNELISSKIKSNLIIDGYIGDNDEVNVSGSFYKYKITATGNISVSSTWSFLARYNPRFSISEINNRFYSELDNYGVGDTIFISLNQNKNNRQYVIPCSINNTRQYGAVSTDDKIIYFFIANKLIKLNPDGSSQFKQMPAEILSLHVDKHNFLWVGLLNNGVTILDNSLQEIEKLNLLQGKSVSSITNDSENGIWISSLESGVFYLKSKHVFKLKEDSSAAHPVSFIYPLNDSAFLFANTMGLKLFNKNIVSYVLPCPNQLINDIFIDNNNIVLAGNIKENKLIYSYPRINNVERRVLLINSSSKIIRHSSLNYFLTQGAMLQHLNFNNLSEEKIDKLASSLTIAAKSPAQAEEYRKVYYKMMSSKFSSQIWDSISQSLNGSDFAGYSKIAKVTPLEFKANFVFEDKQKEVWIGSQESLYKLDILSGKVIPFKKFSSILSNGVSCMSQTDNGIYCIGIRFGGLALIWNDSIIATITEKEGLLSNSVKYILPLKNEVWVATSKGISVVSISSFTPFRYSISNIGKNFGLFNTIIYQLVPFSGNMLVATSNGIFVIEQPGNMINSEPQQIPFYIQTISYYKGDTNNIRSLSVPYSDNRVKIQFCAINYNSPDEIQYYYRILQLDTVWRIKSGTEILLENLSPGNYTVELKAGIFNQRRSSEVRSININVEKPWWQNNWFRLSIVLFLSLLIYLLYKSRINKIKIKEEQNTRLLELEQTALRAQMNPHFIFNSLTSIQQLIVTNKNKEANNYLVSFARLIRKTLELSSRAFIKIDEEKDYLLQYIHLEKLRLPDVFEVNFNIQNGIGNMEIPNMMIQPIIENAIRHGVKPLENRKGIITVEIKKENEYIVCSVSDNGVGRNAYKSEQVISIKEHKSFGTEVVSKRLKLLSNEKHQYFVETHDLKNEATGEAEGTTVILYLPFKITV